MNLMLDTFKVRRDGVTGRLFTDSGELIAVTLEHAYESGVEGYAPKVPAGTYRCVRGWHQLHKGGGLSDPFETFEVTDVPGHAGILFHTGNFNRDSAGCILVGARFADIGNDGTVDVADSRAAFARFMRLQDGVDEFELRVVRNPMEG